LYAAAPVFVYPSSEPRHLHYSPLEAMVIGTPVVYRQGSLLDQIAGKRLPGACADDEEMRSLARRLLAGDRALAEQVRAAQGPILEAFSADLARRQWQSVYEGTAA
jgi:glycosyltransferase involved in cell wall biosynthesis